MARPARRHPSSAGLDHRVGVAGLRRNRIRRAIHDNDDVVGFVSLSTTTHFSGEVDAYIGELVVAWQAEGEGVGTALVAAAERRARADGRRCITLTTGAANERALRFYRQLGYLDEDVKLTKVLSD